MYALIFLLLTAFLAATIIAFAVVRMNAENKLAGHVKCLFSKSDKFVGKVFTYRIISDLPDPVQRYFRYVLSEGQPYINYVRLKHVGQFKAGFDKKWNSIKGEEYFTTSKPGFIWIGSLKYLTAIDSFISGRGNLKILLGSFLKIKEAKGFKYSQGELQRWLGESVWFPTNLLPSENVKWSAIDYHSAKLTYTYKKFNLYYIVTFNETGQIMEMETKRFMGDGNPETWIGKLSCYKKYHGILVPTKLEASWKTRDIEFSYAKFTVTELEYNNPERF